MMKLLLPGLLILRIYGHNNHKDYSQIIGDKFIFNHDTLETCFHETLDLDNYKFKLDDSFVKIAPEGYRIQVTSVFRREEDLANDQLIKHIKLKCYENLNKRSKRQASKAWGKVRAAISAVKPLKQTSKIADTKPLSFGKKAENFLAKNQNKINTINMGVSALNTGLNAYNTYASIRHLNRQMEAMDDEKSKAKKQEERENKLKAQEEEESTNFINAARANANTLAQKQLSKAKLRIDQMFLNNDFFEYSHLTTSGGTNSPLYELLDSYVKVNACESETITIARCQVTVPKDKIHQLFEIGDCGRFISNSSMFRRILYNSTVAYLNHTTAMSLEKCSPAPKQGGIYQCPMDAIIEKPCIPESHEFCEYEVKNVTSEFVAEKKMKDRYLIATNLKTYSIVHYDLGETEILEVPDSGIFELQPPANSIVEIGKLRFQGLPGAKLQRINHAIEGMEEAKDTISIFGLKCNIYAFGAGVIVALIMAIGFCYRLKKQNKRRYNEYQRPSIQPTLLP